MAKFHQIWSHCSPPSLYFFIFFILARFFSSKVRPRDPRLYLFYTSNAWSNQFMTAWLQEPFWDVLFFRASLCVCELAKIKLFQWAILGLFFSLFSSVQQPTVNIFIKKILLMTAFKPRISGFGSNHYHTTLVKTSEWHDLQYPIRVLYFSLPIAKICLRHWSLWPIL